MHLERRLSISSCSSFLRISSTSSLTELAGSFPTENPPKNKKEELWPHEAQLSQTSKKQKANCKCFNNCETYMDHVRIPWICFLIHEGWLCELAEKTTSSEPTPKSCSYLADHSPRWHTLSLLQHPSFFSQSSRWSPKFRTPDKRKIKTLSIFGYIDNPSWVLQEVIAWLLRWEN